MTKRGRSKRRKPTQHSRPASTRTRVPGAPTLFRFGLINEETRDLMEKSLGRLKPLLWLRDRKHVKQIQPARSPQALFDLLPLASGLADSAWQEQMRQYPVQFVKTMVGEAFQAPLDRA